MNVHEKLLHVQRNLKAPKSQYNKFGDFHYRSCEDIQEAIKPLLAEVRAVLLTGDEVVQIGSRFYIKATAIFQDTESPERITNTAYARENEEKPKMDAAQITGSCSSYARKYALNGLFCIDDSKDPDTQEPKAPVVPVQKPAAKPRQQRGQARQQGVSKTDIEKLCSEAERTGTDLAKVRERYRVQSIHELTQEQYQRAMSAFRKMETVPPPAPDEQYELNFDENEMPFR